MRGARLDEYLTANDLESVWFARPNGFAWLTGGSNVVDREGDVGVAAAGYDGDGVTVVTDNIEAPRLAAEELDDGVDVVETDWYADSLAAGVKAHADEPAAADFDVPGFEAVDASALRQPLTDDDVENYRELGQTAAAAVEAVCDELQPDDTEHEVASALRVALSARGIEAPVVLVGGAERAQRYRHYTPKGEPLGDYALLSVTAERDGLHASLTRTVAFDPPEWLADRHDAAMTVEATALAATREAAANGDDAGTVFEAVQDAYAAVGYEGEWRRHHQGGAAGFDGREWIATPDSDAPVTTPMGYAWNPTVQGAKSEDTVLVTEDGFETLTRTGRWPTEEVEAVDRDATVERHALRTP
ncbi:M24 family metallopeptidase [Halostella litorea]|uniref:M24 family metallopeptidase n=1 Tax=Halostella litorea TaxID=2528831 RepID=UPI00109207C2|nr:M24 family metallopeptidase [Halostella litorea]